MDYHGSVVCCGFSLLYTVLHKLQGKWKVEKASSLWIQWQNTLKLSFPTKCFLNFIRQWKNKLLIKVTDSHKLHINCFRLTIKVVMNKTLKSKQLFYKKLCTCIILNMLSKKKTYFGFSLKLGVNYTIEELVERVKACDRISKHPSTFLIFYLFNSSLFCVLFWIRNHSKSVDAQEINRLECTLKK